MWSRSSSPGSSRASPRARSGPSPQSSRAAPRAPRWDRVQSPSSPPVGWRGTFWALAVGAVLVTVLVLRCVPRDERDTAAGASLLADLAGLLSVRLWLVLLACVTTSGGVLALYSFIAPVLIDRSGV